MFFGEPTAVTPHTFNIVGQPGNTALELIRPGTPCADVDR